MSHFAKWSQILLLVSILVASLSSQSAAQDPAAIWGGGTGTWFPTGLNTTNWFCIKAGFGFLCGPPNGSGWTANIGTGTGKGPINGTVILNASVDLPGGVVLGNGGVGNLQVDSAVNSLTAGTMIVGNSVPYAGTLTIENGGVVSDSIVYIGALKGSNGSSATVTGAGSRWTINGHGGLGMVDVAANSQTTATLKVTNGARLTDLGIGFLVGGFGKGTLMINGAGRVSTVDGIIASASSSSGTAIISGPGSRWNDSGVLFVGQSGQGKLTIDAGGVMKTTGALLGFANSSSGAVIVSGLGSHWNVGGLTVGEGGQGKLTIDAGGVVTTAGADLAYASGSTANVTVNGSGSRWDNSDGSIIIGSYGQANLLIKSGSMVTNSGNGYLANGANGTGTAVVNGAGSQWNSSGTLYVGYVGNGTLTIQNGGVVNGGSGFISGFVGSEGFVRVTGSGSRWNSGTSLEIGNRGNGTLVVQNGGTVQASDILIGTNGTVDAKGGILIGNVFNQGILDPLGTVNLLGDYTQEPNGTLVLDVAGIGLGRYGQLDITGNGSFDGTIDLAFINGFAPSKSNVFNLVNLSGIGDFSGANIEISGLQPGFLYSDGFANGSFELTALNDGISAAPTPEPGSLSMLGAGLGALWALALCTRLATGISKSRPAQNN